jgi:hypothetical protein
MLDKKEVVLDMRRGFGPLIARFICPIYLDYNNP